MPHSFTYQANPALSLSLLFISYATFSWSLSDAAPSSEESVFIAHEGLSWLPYTIPTTSLILAAMFLFALAQALLLTTFSAGFRLFFRKWLRSDLGYFSVVVLLAFSIAVVLVWNHIFEYVIMIIGAEILSRLDLQNVGCNRWQSLGVLTFVSVLGLAVGWICHNVVAHP